MSWGIIFRSFVFYTLFIISIPPTAVSLWMLPMISPANAWQLCTLWGKLVNFLLYYLCKIEITVEGGIPKIENPTLIIANHTGPWETVALMPYIPFKFSYVLKQELISWKYNFFALGLRALNPIPISREANAGDFNIMKKLSLEHFKNNRHVLIFPGGTRKPLEESVDFGPGGLLLAKKLQCQVLPVFIDSEKWARGKYIKDYGLLFPGKIRIYFGETVPAEKISGNKVKDIYAEMLEFYKSKL